MAAHHILTILPLHNLKSCQHFVGFKITLVHDYIIH